MVIRSPYPDPEIPDVSLPDFVFAATAGRGTKAAIIDGSTGRQMSYQQLASAVTDAAWGLRSRGFARGDVLAICLPNSPEFVIAYYAVLSASGAVTTLNPACTEAEAEAQLTDARARWLVTTPELAEKLSGAAATARVQETFVVGGSGAGAFESLLVNTADATPLDVSPDDVAALLYSSGTTGLPKGVMLTHRSLVAGVCILRSPEPVRRDDLVLAALPLYHISGMEIVMNHALASGATLVTMPRFELEAFLGIIDRYRITRVVVAPPIVLALAKHPVVDSYDLSSLRVLMCGAAPLSGDLARACAQRLGCRVKQGYGMTEVGPVCITPDDGPDKPASIGPPAPGVQCRIVDVATGRDVADGLTGELLTRTPAAMRGYLGNLAATAATIDGDGWIHTGDIVRSDVDGWFHVVDRVKELIKYKGHQVAPAELEAILLAHPAVADAAVVPSPDSEAGEVPKAFVVRRGSIDGDELLAFVAGKVSPYKKVRRLEFIDAIPKSASGKILRRLLVERERAAAALELVGAGL
jgi:acyl-CoA synthetase (AMP-forming)/AMP-acid ligase II